MTTWYSNYHPGRGGRRWQDARGTERGGGFISHGGSDTRVRQFAEEVKAGDLLYVKVLLRTGDDPDPLVARTGFIGIARVLADPRRHTEAELLIDGEWTPFDEVPKVGDYIHHWNGQATVEYVAAVDWLTVLDEPLPVPGVAYRAWVVNLDTAPTGPRSIARLTALLPMAHTARSLAPAPPSPLDGGQGYSDLTGVVEQAGMRAVLAHLDATGWRAEDVSDQDGLGYDVRATHLDTADVRLVEVKATSGPAPNVWLTQSEIDAARDYPKQWRGAVLTRAMAPRPDELRWFTADQALRVAKPDRYRARLGETVAP